MDQNTGKNGSKNILKNKAVFSWVLYDWANSAFATTVIAGFFPIFFKSYWSGDVDVHQSSFYLGVGHSVASFVLALLAPFLGACADQSFKKKKFLAIFAFLGIGATVALFFIGMGQWPLAIFFFSLAALGFAGGNIFYDALIVNVSSSKKMDVISGLGYALGYLGGGVLFSVNVLMTLKPNWFGLVDRVQAVKWSFISVGVWWFLFSIPLFLYVHEPKEDIHKKYSLIFKQAWSQLAQTFSNLKKNKTIFIFLIGYFFYIDGVNTIIKMAVDYGLSLGFQSDHLIIALLLTQFVGFPAAIVFGLLGEKIGAKKGIFIGLIVYMSVTLYGSLMDTVAEFYIMAAVIGLVQGGVQSLSRSFYARLIPQHQSAEYFGFYNMLGKFSAIMGPLLVGWVSLVSQNSRLSLLVILFLFLVGFFFLSRVKETPSP